MARTQAKRFIVAVVGALLALGSPGQAAQYTAFSLKVAQARIERAGEGWREQETDVAKLADINKVEGFVYEAATGDLILVGQHEEDRAPLNLDDLVVALRARFRYNEWPLVSIDPTPDTEKTQMQHVRFEGGIDETAFGQALFDADYRLKQIGMGLEGPGIGDLLTYWDRSEKEVESGTVTGQREVNSRFWFYPINPHVVVREGVCVVRGLKVGVFTEVLAAKIDGKPVEDLKSFKLEKADAFATDVSERFDDLCGAQLSFNRLRGLQELVAVSKALEEMEERPDLSWWLEKYPLVKVETSKEVKVLQRRHERGWFEVSGGVHLTALAMRLKAGDVRALRNAVLEIRPSVNALSWTFVVGDWVIPIGQGQLRPEDTEALLQHAMELTRANRSIDALVLADAVMDVVPDSVMAWSAKGEILLRSGRLEEALICFDRALDMQPGLLLALLAKGLILGQGFVRWKEAAHCFEQAIEGCPQAAVAWELKGVAMSKLGRFSEALTCFEKAIQIDASYSNAWCSKGEVLWEFGRKEEALESYRRATEVEPKSGKTWYQMGTMLYELKRYADARKAFEKAADLGNTDGRSALEILQEEGY